MTVEQLEQGKKLSKEIADIKHFVNTLDREKNKYSTLLLKAKHNDEYDTTGVHITADKELINIVTSYYKEKLERLISDFAKL